MRTLNGQTLKQLLISGSNNLYNHYPEVDALNVFPVPDGDTGMNMNLTLTSGSKEIQNRSDESAYEISKVFSRGLLMGARGNSGVITSQIFRGFSKGLDGLDLLMDVDLGYATILHTLKLAEGSGAAETVAARGDAIVIEEVGLSLEVDGSAVDGK